MTTLAFNLDEADLAVQAFLKSIENLNVHVGEVSDSDASTKTIGAPLPYVLYRISLPYATSKRVGGWLGREWSFSLTYTHSFEGGVNALAIAIRNHLAQSRVEVGGELHRFQLVDPELPESPVVDQVWSRPGGGSIHYGVDRFRLVRGG